MKFTLSALKKYLETSLSAAEVGHACTMLGLEIEEMVDKAAPLADFVVAEILECEPHTNSDHLHILQVADGSGTRQVVCGAPNARKGLKSILARPGCVIPTSGDAIKKGKIRGEESLGMMCSLRELGLGESHEGIIELPEDAAVGESASVALGRIYNLDVLYDAEATPNRPDYLGVMGIARDLSAGGYGNFISPEIPKVPMTYKSPITVENRAEELAKYFNMQQVRNVENCASPSYIREYLEAVGMKSHDALVDITNFMMHNMNRPLHVFDADKIRGTIVVDTAKGGEKFVALDENTYTLEEGDIIISDDSGVISLAGVMGGLSTGTSLATKNVLIEAAYFNPASIRKTAKRLGLESESKYRFERGVDPSSCDWGLQRAVGYVMEFCGGEASEVITTGRNPYRDTPLKFPTSYFKKRMGMDVPPEEMQRILSKLGCVVSNKKDWLWITPPSWRADLVIAADFCEEIGRIYGYDKLPMRAVLPEGIVQVLSLAQARESAVRRTLAAAGLTEVYTWSFMSSLKQLGLGENIKIANPITADLDAMRRSIVPNLLDGLAWNIANSARAANPVSRAVSSVALFEVGPVFYGANPGEQHIYASGIRCGTVGDKAWELPKRSVGALDAKADLFAALGLYGLGESDVELSRESLPAWVNPYASARVIYKGADVGIFGEVHPMTLKKFNVAAEVAAFFEVNLSLLPAEPLTSSAKSPLKSSGLAAVSRELSFAFNSDAAAGVIYKAARKAAGEMVNDITIFDIYDKLGDGKKAVGLSLQIQPADKTLSDAEIAAIVDTVAKTCEKLGGELRK